MNLREQINSDLKEALIAKKESVVSTLRLLKAAIENEEKSSAAAGQLLDDQKIQKIIRGQAKKRKEAIVEYQKGGRKDLASKEREELEILGQYLPEELNEEEIEKIVEAAARKLSGSDAVDFGKIMGVVMKEVAGRAGGEIVKEIVQEKLKKSD